MTARQKYWLGLLGSLIVGLLLKLLPHWKHFQSLGTEWTQFTSEAGSALIIAFFLAVLVDAALKEELLTEFAKDVSGHIIGNLLPLRLRKHLMDYLEMYLVRYNWNITYTLKPYRDRYVEVTVFSDYEIENRSSEEQTFEFVIKVEKGWHAAVGKENLITMVSINEGTPFRPGCDPKDGNWVYEHKPPVKLPPYDKDNPQRFRFRTESVQYFYECAFSPFISMWPVPNATVTVRYPKDTYDVMFDPTFKPRKAPVQNDLQDGTQWDINEPILPGQGFFVRWSRRRLPATTPVAPSIRETAA